MHRYQQYFTKYVHVHSDCIPVKGAVRSAFYDLTRNEIVLFPSDYFDVLNVFKLARLGTIVGDIESEEQKAYFFEFLDFLLNYEFITFLDDVSNFPAIEETWDAPCLVQNAIIDVNKKHHNFEKIFMELNELGCEYVQIRMFSNLLKPKDLMNVLSAAYHKSIQRVELLLKYDDDVKGQYEELLESELIVDRMTIHSAPAQRTVKVSFGYEGVHKESIEKEVSFIEQKLDSNSHCGVINVSNLSVPSVSNFFENKFHNGCLNRKISVDEDGQIKNCPTMQNCFGNIRTDSLIKAIEHQDFKKVWDLNNDQIAVCKDCEFRYVCTGCRALTSNPEDYFSKPLKCSYNPYTAEWEG